MQGLDELSSDISDSEDEESVNDDNDEDFQVNSKSASRSQKNTKKRQANAQSSSAKSRKKFATESDVTGDLEPSSDENRPNFDSFIYGMIKFAFFF